MQRICCRGQMWIQANAHRTSERVLEHDSRGSLFTLGSIFALIAACAHATPIEAATKAAIIKAAESICNINEVDAVTFCIGIRDGVDGGNPSEAHHAGAGFIRDTDKSFIHMLQREMIRGNPIFKTISECGGMDCAK